MSDRDALLRTILADPDDDVCRLVFADWLEENGEADRAHFVRLQIECWQKGKFPGELGRSVGAAARWPYGRTDCPGNPWADWTGTFDLYRPRPMADVVVNIAEQESQRASHYQTHLVWRRGLIWAFVGSVAVWLKRRLWERHPVEVVAWPGRAGADVSGVSRAIGCGSLDRVRELWTNYAAATLGREGPGRL